MVSFIRQAQRRGVQLLVFPECMLSGYAPRYWKDGPPEVRGLREAEEEVARQARINRMALALGTSEKCRGRRYDVAHFIDQTGKRIGRYTKVQCRSPTATKRSTRRGTG